ncbi:MAG TPA: TadE/TadG family type IV pilus assembly protein [Pilimelia sp.]|nr:TadE/TadG family type IV pilus assembly protein [Pilimelia sp.]
MTSRARPAVPPRGAPPVTARDRGAAAVELALVTPLLLLMLFGIIDFGRMLNAQIALTEAAREGARAAALGLPPGPRVARVVRGIPTTVTTTPCPAGAFPGADAVVVVSHPFRPVTPLGPIMTMVGGEEDGSVTITATGVMPCLG